MSENHPLSFKRIRRFLFLYLFRDFDKGTKDVGFEFTTLRPLRDGKVLCHAMTINPKGLRSDKFLVDASTRCILNLPGHYICYWVSGKKENESIYDRSYQKVSAETYVHMSRTAKSVIVFDKQGFEKTAENMVSSPRRYHEKFIRLLRT